MKRGFIMINKLQSLFPSLVKIHEVANKNVHDYHWFTTNDGNIFGILKKELSDKEYKLLHTFLSPYNETFPPVTESEKLWKQRIHSTINEPIDYNYRFIYFSIDKDQISPKSFKEAIIELFDKEIPILWENNTEGILIEEQMNDQEENISYEQIIDILMSDLYVNLKFFVGTFQDHLNDLNQYYENLLSTVKVAFLYSDKTVLHLVDAIPFLIIDKLEEPLKSDLPKVILRDYVHDQEFLHTIETFLESNLNISVAAKKLYMHRNSLQYRIEKFQEHTGIDIRDFQQALAVYLAIVANR